MTKLDEIIPFINKKPSEQWKQIAKKTVCSKKAFDDNIEELRQLTINEGLSPQIARLELNNIAAREGIPYRTFIPKLPAEFKLRRRKQQPKKEPLVKHWKVKFNIPRMIDALKPLHEAGHKLGYIVHDTVNVVDVEYR